MSFTVRPSSCAAVLRTLLLATLLFRGLTATAGIRDAYETSAADLDRDLKQGYALRSDLWNGELSAGGVKRLELTLFRGNDYRFYACTTTKGAKISFHIQDRDGTVVEARSWQKEKDGLCLAGADIVPTSTGARVLVIKVEQTATERTEWSVCYVFK